MTPVRHAPCGRCGNQLARDNPTGRCAACQAAERDRVAQAPQVPADFWDNEALQRALAARHMGRVIRAYRRHPYHGRHPLPQDVVAGWVGITQAQLSRIEHGPAILHLDRLIHWARVLRIPAGYLWFKLPDTAESTAPLGRTVEAEAWSPLLRLEPSDRCGSTAAEDGEVRRRRLLELATLGLASAHSSVALEVLRHDLVQVAGCDGTASLDEWEAVVWDYGYSYAVTPPEHLLTDLSVDLAVAQGQLARLTDEPTRRALLRTIALLEAFLAQTLSNLGNVRAGRRWWRTARATADRARDPEAQTWVRGREIIRGLNERWPLPVVLELADEAVALNARLGLGTGDVLMGRAQVLAAMGRSADARTAMTHVYRTVDQLPGRITSDVTSMYGWSEYRLRHGESLVYTHLGDLPRATAAQDRALALYPAHMFRARAQVQLHQAIALVKGGEAEAGAAHAQRVIGELPEAQRIEVVLEVARSVAQAIPPEERQRSEATALRELLRACAPRPGQSVGPA